jgi:trans-aconitate 2-methyltransferase
MASATRDWDAGTYHRVSVPHEEWARSVLDRLPLQGDETVLDAGCGSGRVTGLLIERLPEGRVVAVDGSASMVEKVRETLRPGDEALVSDLTELELDQKVDAVFSSAVFHWVLDHDLLFRQLRAVLRPGGAIAAQCGGAGNIDRLRKICAGAEETEARLEATGFDRVRCWLQPWTIEPPEPAEFLRTVCLGPHMDRLPEELETPFVEKVLEREPDPLQMEYVRLNIEARA